MSLDSMAPSGECLNGCNRATRKKMPVATRRQRLNRCDREKIWRAASQNERLIFIDPDVWRKTRLLRRHRSSLSRLWPLSLLLLPFFSSTSPGCVRIVKPAESRYSISSETVCLAFSISIHKNLNGKVLTFRNKGRETLTFTFFYEKCKSQSVVITSRNLL